MSSFIDFITGIYEIIALLIEAKQPYVETHFGLFTQPSFIFESSVLFPNICQSSKPALSGPGAMINVITMMQDVCNTQILKAISFFESELRVHTYVDTVSAALKSFSKSHDDLFVEHIISIHIYHFLTSLGI